MEEVRGSSPLGPTILAMRRKEILLEGIYAGTAIAVIFWLIELMCCISVGALSFLYRRQSFSVNFGDNLRSLPVYLLFCIVLGVFLGGIFPTSSLVYASLLIVGVGLFEWASWGEGALKVLWGAPWVRREIWTLILFFFGFLWWRFLRRKTKEELRADHLAAFLILSLFLVVGQHLSVELQFEDFITPLRMYCVLLGFSLVSVLGFFPMRTKIAPLTNRKAQETLLVFSLSVSLLGYLPRWLPAASSQRPNIILIVLDTVRADHLSSYGYSKKTSPHFDQLAEEGVLFETAKTTSHWTPPAHASLFTGLLPSEHGVTSYHLKLRQDCKTLAEHLRRQGYRTFGISANYLVGDGRLDKGFEQFVEPWRHDRFSLASRIGARLNTSDPITAPNVNSLLNRWLVYDNRRDTRPFFLFVNYVDPHLIYQFHPGISERFLTKPHSMEEIKALPQNGRLFFAGKVKYSKEDFQLLSDLYDGEIAYVDHSLGELVDMLRQNRILDKSILVITSDHGEYFGEHGLMTHMCGLYEEALHVPLLVRYPGRIAAKRIQEPVQLTDIPPTLLEVAHLEPLEGIAGKSFVPLLNGGRWESHPLIAEQKRISFWMKSLKRMNPDADLSLFDCSAYSFQEGNYKAILYSNRPPELYDLETDKKEAHNLSRSSDGQRYPIWDHVALFLEGQAKIKKVDSAQRLDHVRELRSLGYL